MPSSKLEIEFTFSPQNYSRPLSQRISFSSQSHATHAARSPNFVPQERSKMPKLTHPQPSTIQISVINESTVLADADVAPVVAVLQKQVTNDFLPAWGTDAELTMVAKGDQPASGSWWLVLLDDSDQANALGYHDLTTEGLPIGKVFH